MGHHWRWGNWAVFQRQVLLHQFHARGNKFDKYVAVEVEILDLVAAQNMLPADIVGIYNLINAPLSRDEGHALDVVEMLKRLAKPGDFFVLKVDIDMSPIKMPLILNLLDDDPKNGRASGLIDEMMFGHRQYSLFLIFLHRVANSVQVSISTPCRRLVHGGLCP